MAWLPGGALNMAHEAIDRHTRGRLARRTALIWLGRNGEREEYTFAQVRDQSNRFANVLLSLGIVKGDRIAIHLDRVPESYFALLGILKTGAIACPVFSGFSPETLRDRMKETEAKVLVTHPQLRRGLGDLVYELFELQHIVIVNKDGREPEHPETADLDYYEEMSKASTTFATLQTSPYDTGLLHYTSGVTGEPKGVLLRHQSIVQQAATARSVLDLRPGDVYWCTADPGWVVGTTYGCLAPWAVGATVLLREGLFEAEAWYRLIQEERVTVWYSAPTALRSLQAGSLDLPEVYDLSSLRHVASVGEVLEADTVEWSIAVLGTPIRNTWLQTETGAIMCAVLPEMDAPPGSVGKPVPGTEMAVLGRDLQRVETGTTGNLAIRPGWPAMLQGYWGDVDEYNSRFKRGWYVTDDMARIDADDYIWIERRIEG
jgi:acetyl-CoA synthetase